MATRRAVISNATSLPRKDAGAGKSKPGKAAPPPPPAAGAELPWAPRANPDDAPAAPAGPKSARGPAAAAAPPAAQKAQLAPEPEGAAAPAPAPAPGTAPAPASKKVRRTVKPVAAAAEQAVVEEQRPRRQLHRGKQRYNGGEGQEDFSFRTGYDDPEALGWRYTGHDSRIGAAYYENDSGIKIDAFYNTGTIKMSHPRPAPPPGGQPRKGPPPTSYHTKLSAQRWRDVLTAPPPPEDEEDDSEALGEDELPFEFPRGYDDPVDLDWEYLGSEPALKLAIYQRLEPGGKGLKLHAYYTTASIKLVFARPNKRAPPEHPPVYFRRLRPAAWRRVLTDPRANLELGYLAEPRGSSSSSSNRQQQHQ